MEVYEIRITKRGGHQETYVGMMASDYAAIRRANSLAREDDLVEVIKGPLCIFSGTSKEAERYSSLPVRRPG
jgi:hypothetical protein